MTVAWTALPANASDRRRGGDRWRIPAICAALAVAPDLDMLVTTHRAAWHSLASAVIVATAAWLLHSRRRSDVTMPPVRLALACGLAWGSHVALDWLGKDGAPPYGVMALWPFSRDYFISGLDVFGEVSRRYWLPLEFFWGNLGSVARELAILGPIAAIAYWTRYRPD
jgi:hypothetical protein